MSNDTELWMSKNLNACFQGNKAKIWLQKKQGTLKFLSEYELVYVNKGGWREVKGRSKVKEKPGEIGSEKLFSDCIWPNTTEILLNSFPVVYRRSTKVTALQGLVFDLQHYRCCDHHCMLSRTFYCWTEYPSTNRSII